MSAQTIIWTDASRWEMQRMGGGRSRNPKAKRCVGLAYVAVQDDVVVSESAEKIAQEMEVIRAELMAVLMALRSPWAEGADIRTDCEHVAHLFWRHPPAYKLRGTRLHRKALDLVARTGATVRWVPSHEGHAYQTRADQLAREVIGLPAFETRGMI